jgi:hypothetical protein
MTNTPDSDDALIEAIRAHQPGARIDALLDAVNDTATWQPAPVADTDGRAR